MPNKTIFFNKDDFEIIKQVQESRPNQDGTKKGLGKIFGELAREEQNRKDDGR